jgi:hypothetical protein
MSLMQVKGIVFTKRVDMGELGIKEGAAVKSSAQSQGSAIGVLLNAWAFQYNLIRDLTGINPAADGSLSEDALLGVNEMAKLASNTAIKHIVDASVSINKKICEVISTRIGGIFTHKEASHIKDIYVNVIGSQMLDAIEVMKDRNLHEYGFTFEMQATSQEIAEFKESLGISLQAGEIDVEVKNQAVNLAKTNIKIASKYLFYQRKKRNKERQEEQMAMAKNKSENDSQAAQAKSQSDSQKYMAQKDMDLNFEREMSKIRLQEAKAMLDINRDSIESKFKQDVYLKQVDGQSGQAKSEYMEDRKDQRKKQEGSQQSKLIDQRANDKESIDFEDDLDFEDMMN